MDYKIISCDDHLDLGYLPKDFWTRAMPAALGERRPHIEERGDDAVWVCDGKVWGGWRGKPRPPGEAKRPSPLVTAFDRGGIADTSDLRPAVPALRLADMARDGVYAQVIYGPVFSIRTDDAALRDACYRAYNDSLADLFAPAADRLLGVPMLPESPEAATAEVLRLAKKGGVRQANLQIAEVKPRLHDPAWERLWSALEETGILLSFHVAVFATPKDDPAFGKPASVFASTKAFIEQFLDPFVDLFAWGILERHPRLKIVMAEAGVGWLPWLVQELDHRFERLHETKDFWDGKGGIALKTKPSDLFKRQIYASFQEDAVAVALVPFFGDGHVLWASDYPHPDSTWPNSIAKIEEQMSHLAPAMRKKLLHDNAAALYGLTY